MSITYVQKNVNAVQTKRERAVSLSDFSSQNESLQCKTHLMNGFAQYSQIAQNNQKLNVVQCMGQDRIEKEMGSQFGIDEKTIEDYGGFCGGWSLMMLQNPIEATEKWEKFEEYVEKNVNGDTSVNVDDLKSIFVDVVKQQLYLSKADGDRVFDDSDYGLATKLLEEKFLEKVNGYEEGKYTPVVTETLSFSRDIGAEPEINVEKILRKEFICNDVLSKVKAGKWLLSTDVHYMSIAFDEKCNQDNDFCCGYVSETNSTGLARFESQDELVDILAKEESWKDSDEIYDRHLIYKCDARKIG